MRNTAIVRLAKRAAAVSAAVVLATGLAAGPAQAGDWTPDHGASSQQVSEAPIGTTATGASWGAECSTFYTTGMCHTGTMQGYREDQNRGSRIQANVSFKETGYKSDSRGAYEHVDWYYNGNKCYVTSFSDTGGSIGCSSGWWGNGSTDTDRTHSTSYVSWAVWNKVNASGDSGRGLFKAALDIANASDKYTAGILRGSCYC